MAGTPTFRKAGKTRNQVRIEYTDRKGRNIVRNVRPYEIKNGYLWATDTRHGAGRIHSFKISRVRSAEPLENRYRPRWDVKL
jgi:predicted DNA-binding transcriptional regulator YafY